MKPSSLTIGLLLLWLCLGIAVAFQPVLGDWWEISLYMLGTALILDGVWLRQLRQFQVQREVNNNLPINSWSSVTLKLRHQHSSAIKLAIFDHHPANFEVQGQPHKLVLPSKHQAEVEYKVKPLRRGDDRFLGVDLLLSSPLHLWQRKLFIQHEQAVKVYPNFAEIAHYALLATDNRLSQMGVRRRQRRGEGQDFHQLREYRVGDSLKQVDWKATSRQRKLISREYQDERDQQIVFLVDCGRRMRHMEEGQAHLDQALNAMLLLAYVSIRQGDSAGFLSFAGGYRSHAKWSAPQKGAHIVNHLLNQAYDLQSSLDAADYISAAQNLLSLQRKRSLVVIMTNTRDEDQDDLLQAIRLLSRKHLVVLADLQEPGLRGSLNEAPNDLDSALQFHGVVDYLQRRKQAHEALSHAGALCIDTTAKDLPVRLVNQYLDIKQSGRL